MRLNVAILIHHHELGIVVRALFGSVPTSIARVLSLAHESMLAPFVLFDPYTHDRAVAVPIRIIVNVVRGFGAVMFWTQIVPWLVGSFARRNLLGCITFVAECTIGRGSVLRRFWNINLTIGCYFVAGLGYFLGGSCLGNTIARPVLRCVRYRIGAGMIARVRNERQ